MRTFIAFTGVKESGKTTSFKFLKEAHPEIQEVTLAKHLKDVCAKVFGIERDWFDDQKLKEKELDRLVYLTGENVAAVIKAFDYTPDFDKHVRPHIGTVLESPRRVAQYIGTEVLRAFSEDVHCIYAAKSLPETGTFVVTDMRFPNEFEFFQKKEGDLFFPLYISNYAAESKVGPDSHASERYVLELAKKCEKIDNNDSMDVLKERILSKYEELMKRARSA